METPGVPEVPAKESRTGAIIGSIAAILLCGVSGLCLVCPLSFLGMTNVLDEWLETDLPDWLGIVGLCLSVIFIVIGIVVPIMLLRKKKPKTVSAEMPPSEPLPPAS